MAEVCRPLATCRHFRFKIPQTFLHTLLPPLSLAHWGGGWKPEVANWGDPRVKLELQSKIGD